eukprot:5548596-Pyramimonas_sp.AAC.1
MRPRNVRSVRRKGGWNRMRTQPPGPSVKLPAGPRNAWGHEAREGVGSGRRKETRGVVSSKRGPHTSGW